MTTSTLVWESIDSTTKRARTPTGWIVTTNGNAETVFVPDADGSWLKVSDPIPVPPPVVVPPVVTPPVVTPPVTPTFANLPKPGRWIGTNITSINDWSTEQPFSNFLLKSRAWISGSATAWDDGRAVAVDAQGYPTSLLPGQIARLMIFSSGDRPNPAEGYKFTFSGKGTFSLSGGTAVSNADGSWTLHPAATGNVNINILTTDSIDHMRNFKMVRGDQLNVTSLFNPDFVSDLKNYSCIRFMDWQVTNYIEVGSPPVKVVRPAAWLPGDFAPLDALPLTLVQGVPYSVMVALANETGCDMWINIPIVADATYWQKALNFVKANLKSTLRCYVESGNEIFNSTFPSGEYLAPKGTFDQKMTAHAQRTALITKDVKAILGAQGVAVLAGWNANSFWSDDSLSIMKTAGQLPDVLAVAPYFGTSLADNLTIYADGSLAKAAHDIIDNSTATTAAKDCVVAHLAIAKKYGVQLAAYEAGQSVVPNGGQVVNADPRMGEIYKTYLAAWRDVTSHSLYMNFSRCGQWSKDGSWGNRITDTPVAPATTVAVTPKETAIKAAALT